MPKVKSDGYMPPLYDHKDHVAYLASNGYFDGDFPEASQLKENDPVMQRATQLFQEFTGLVPDGIFGAVSERMTYEKRCALPDLNKGFVMQRGKWVEFSIKEDACTRKWSTKELTCTHNALSFSTLSSSETDAAWWKAKVSWMKVCGIKFKRVPWNGKRSANFYHDKQRMDGRSGKLAHHYLPNCNQSSSSALEGMFDSGERWTPNFFQAVCAHEDGHGLGLTHDSNRNALLYPYYQRNIVEPTARDIKRVVGRYGKPVDVPDDPTQPPTQPPTIEQRMLNAEMQLAVHEVLIKQLMER